jgi:hypothetical protein
MIKKSDPDCLCKQSVPADPIALFIIIEIFIFILRGEISKIKMFNLIL